MKKLEFEFRNLKFAYENPSSDWEYLLGPEADFSIVSSGKTLLYQPYFNVGEFAFQLKTWKREQMPKEEDFFYDPIESDEQEFLFIKYAEGLWNIGSAFQLFDDETRYQSGELVAAINVLSNNVKLQVQEDFGVDLDYL